MPSLKYIRDRFGFHNNKDLLNHYLKQHAGRTNKDLQALWDEVKDTIADVCIKSEHRFIQSTLSIHKFSSAR